ncbi:MAG: cytochrome P450, partial [Actinomycetota bacterium]
RYVMRNAELFSSAHGLMLSEARPRVADDAGSNIAALLEDGGGGADHIALTDPPRHWDLRRVMNQEFVTARMDALRPEMERCCDQLLDQIVAGEPMDWVKQTAERLPLLVTSAVLGLPDDNTDDIRRWSEAMEVVLNPPSEEGMMEAFATFASSGPYLKEQFAERRSCPGRDMLTLLSVAEQKNAKISEANITSMAQSVIAGGFGTTSAALAGFVALMAEHPDQLESLVADRSLIPQAVEEVLRWVTPQRGMLRTVTQETELRGHELLAGEHVYLLLDSANRDEAAFKNPDVFDVTRKREQPILSFGHGPHVCVAAPLARLEIQMLAERLIDRFPRWTLAGEPRRAWNAIRSSWAELPVVFSS